MFDDDIPSVLELEMEDMEQWIEKQGGFFPNHFQSQVNQYSH